MSKDFLITVLLNNVQKHVRTPKLPNELINHWGSLLIVLIENEINPLTLEKQEGNSCESEHPTFQELIAFLQRTAHWDDRKLAQSRSKSVTENYSTSQSR